MRDECFGMAGVVHRGRNEARPKEPKFEAGLQGALGTTSAFRPQAFAIVSDLKGLVKLGDAGSGFPILFAHFRHCCDSRSASCVAMWRSQPLRSRPARSAAFVNMSF